MDNEKSCFIIMPITTPNHFASKYNGDNEHFLHVLDHLIIPAVKDAGLKPIKPNSKGSEVIHGDIILNIESADFVLCDMSILNPNVFFELGIRTAINKPVCIIKDDLTADVPFDTGIINHHEYSSSLTPWTLGNEVEKLTQHIIESIERSNGCNSLWKYFSLTSIAKPIESNEGLEGQIEILNMQIEALRKEIKNEKALTAKFDFDEIADRFISYLNKEHINIASFVISKNSILINGLDESDETEVMIKAFAAAHNLIAFKRDGGVIFKRKSALSITDFD